MITAHDGRRLGRVQDLLLDPPARQVRGLVLGRSGWLRPAQAVGWDALEQVGRDAVVVRREADMVGEGTLWSAVCGKPLLSGGEELGHLSDLLIAPDGAVTGYLVSHGVIDDLLSGQVVLSGPVALAPGAEAVFLNTPGDAGQQGGYDALS